MPLGGRKLTGLFILVFGGFLLAVLAFVTNDSLVLVVSALLIVVVVLAVGASVIDGQRDVRRVVARLQAHLDQVVTDQEHTQQALSNLATAKEIRRRLGDQEERIDALVARRFARLTEARRRERERLELAMDRHVVRLELAQELVAQQSTESLRREVRRLEHVLVVLGHVPGAWLSGIEDLEADEVAALAYCAATVRRLRPRAVAVHQSSWTATVVIAALVARYGGRCLLVGDVYGGDGIDVSKELAVEGEDLMVAALDAGLASDPVSLLAVGFREGAMGRALDEAIGRLGQQLADGAVVVNTTMPPGDDTGWVAAHEDLAIEGLSPALTGVVWRGRSRLGKTHRTG